VRELRNVIERIVIMNRRDAFRSQHLPPLVYAMAVAAPERVHDVASGARRYERDYILKKLDTITATSAGPPKCSAGAQHCIAMKTWGLR